LRKDRNYSIEFRDGVGLSRMKEFESGGRFESFEMYSVMEWVYSG